MADSASPPEESPPLETLFPGIIGRSPAMLALFDLIRKVAASSAPALVLGENGTGKELVARALHQLWVSSRPTAGPSVGVTPPFIAQNCSALNDNLLDSELFGHKRGAFTGALADKPGLFSLAHGGTLFLDEVGDMSRPLQVKLLRVLQEGTFVPVGGIEPVHVTVRVIAATNRDLRGLTSAGVFREDLLYRIQVFTLTVPPLRERREDIPALVAHFLAKHSPLVPLRTPPPDGSATSPENRTPEPLQVTRSCLRRLMAYPWPGNVRELSHEVERLVVLSGGGRTLGPQWLSPHVRRPGKQSDLWKGPIAHSLPEAVAALEREMIAAALERHRGNRTFAAADLHVSRRNLIRKIREYGLDVPVRTS